MSQAKILSYKYNMAMGLFPVLVYFLLCEFVPHNVAIYLSTAVSLGATLNILMRKRVQLPHYILYGITGMWILLSLWHLLWRCTCPPDFYSLTVEFSMLLPPFVLLCNGKRLLRRCARKTPPSRRVLHSQGAEAAIVASRVLTIPAGLHLIALLCMLLFVPNPGEMTRFILFQVAPPTVFLLAILLNGAAIGYFNRLMSQTVFFPIVNKQGDVIGKCMAADALSHKTLYINPVVRIAVSVHGMPYLRPRTESHRPEPDKIDIAIEEYLLYGETLEQGVQRILQHYLPNVSTRALRFNFMYHYENESSNRLAYLFTLPLDNETPLQRGQIKGGKLWTFRQMNHEQGHNFFSSFLEYEFEELKTIIYTREKYKES